MCLLNPMARQHWAGLGEHNWQAYTYSYTYLLQPLCECTPKRPFNLMWLRVACLAKIFQCPSKCFKALIKPTNSGGCYWFFHNFSPKCSLSLSLSHSFSPSLLGKHKNCNDFEKAVDVGILLPTMLMKSHCHSQFTLSISLSRSLSLFRRHAHSAHQWQKLHHHQIYKMRTGIELLGTKQSKATEKKKEIKKQSLKRAWHFKLAI